MRRRRLAEPSFVLVGVKTGGEPVEDNLSEWQVVGMAEGGPSVTNQLGVGPAQKVAQRLVDPLRNSVEVGNDRANL